MSRTYKKAYKKCLIAISINIFSGHHRTAGQDVNLEIINTIKSSRYDKKEMEAIYKIISENVNQSLLNGKFKEPFNDDFINGCIGFMRRNLLNIKDEKICLFQGKELKRILYIKEYFITGTISDFTWIELELNRGLIPTFPEMIIFNDLKVLWNKYIDTIQLISEERSKEIYIGDGSMSILWTEI